MQYLKTDETDIEHNAKKKKKNPFSIMVSQSHKYSGIGTIYFPWKPWKWS